MEPARRAPVVGGPDPAGVETEQAVRSATNPVPSTAASGVGECGIPDGDPALLGPCRLFNLLGRAVIDLAAERARLEKQRGEKQKHLAGLQAQLANENFVKGAPAEVVQQRRDKVAELENQLRVIEETLRDLEQG